MNLARQRLQKLGLVALAALLLVGSAGVQRDLNRMRGDLGLTRVEPLKNAPPMLVFTTVVLGGFRGLIANALWVRAAEPCSPIVGPNIGHSFFSSCPHTRL